MEPTIALSHAGGFASEAILEKLSESGTNPDSLVLLDDESRAGSRYAFAGSYLKSANQNDFDYSSCAVLLMPEADADLEQAATSQGCLLVSHQIQRDNPAVFCSDGQDIEIAYNATSLRLTGPELSCMLPILLELDRLCPIRRVNATLMRSSEFYGKAAVDELASQTVNLLNARDVKATVYADQIAFNLLPEPAESLITDDLAHFLGNSSFSNQVQIVSAPVFHGFVASIQLEFDADIALKTCKQRLSSLENVIVKKGTASQITDCNQSFNCVISLLEQLPKQASRLQFWMIADPMRYGIANNYVKVTDFLLKSFL